MTETQEIILNSLGVLCREYPQQRLGQIIYNYVLTHCPNQDPFFIRDEELLEILEKELEKISN